MFNYTLHENFVLTKINFLNKDVVVSICLSLKCLSVDSLKLVERFFYRHKYGSDRRTEILRIVSRSKVVRLRSSPFLYNDPKFCLRLVV